jgi:hypothetical protein
MLLSLLSAEEKERVCGLREWRLKEISYKVFWECDSENGHRVALDSQSLQYSYVSVGQLIHHVAFERLDVGVLF